MGIQPIVPSTLRSPHRAACLQALQHPPDRGLHGKAGHHELAASQGSRLSNRSPVGGNPPALEGKQGDGYIAAVVVNKVRGINTPREAYRDELLACGHRWQTAEAALWYAIGKGRRTGTDAKPLPRLLDQVAHADLDVVSSRKPVMEPGSQGRNSCGFDGAPSVRRIHAKATCKVRRLGLCQCIGNHAQ